MKTYTHLKPILIFMAAIIIALFAVTTSVSTEASTSVSQTKIYSIKTTNAGIKLTWKKVSGVMGYQIFRSVNDGKYILVKTISKNSTASYQDKAVKNGNRYRYLIKTCITKKKKTAVSTGVKSKNLIYLTKPDNLKASISDGKVKVSWMKNSKRTGYELRYQVNGKGKSVKTTKTVYSFTVPKVTVDADCSIAVRVYRKDGGVVSYSPWSKTSIQIRAPSEPSITGFEPASIPEFSGTTVQTVNDDEPFFTDEEKTYNGTFIRLSELDPLGRCGTAFACVGQETEPDTDREDIGHVYPSGWNQLKLSDGTYLYNRCHLLMHALTGLNDDNRNLITGTRQFNASGKDGMLPWETTVKYMVDNFNAHVVYRVTPIFEGENLVAKGVLMEAYCIEYPDSDATFCRFIYNVQEDVTIDYATGQAVDHNDPSAQQEKEITYVLNTNTKKFHKTTCGSVNGISEKYREDSTLSREELIAEGYSPCGNCKP